MILVQRADKEVADHFIGVQDVDKGAGHILADIAADLADIIVGEDCIHHIPVLFRVGAVSGPDRGAVVGDLDQGFGELLGVLCDDKEGLFFVALIKCVDDLRVAELIDN